MRSERLPLLPLCRFNASDHILEKLLLTTILGLLAEQARLSPFLHIIRQKTERSVMSPQPQKINIGRVSALKKNAMHSIAAIR